MTFGQRKDFVTGLDGLIGPPHPNLFEGMRWEHCERKDSEEPFKTSNSNIKTTSLAEFFVVFEPDVIEKHQQLPSSLPGSSKDLNSEPPKSPRVQVGLILRTAFVATSVEPSNARRGRGSGSPCPRISCLTT